MSKVEGDPLLRVVRDLPDGKEPKPPDRLDKMGPIGPITLVTIIVTRVGRNFREKFSRKHPNPSPTSPQDK